MTFRLSEEQKKILEARAKAEGYSKVAVYVRAKIFRPLSMEEKVNAIYEKICRDI